MNSLQPALANALTPRAPLTFAFHECLGAGSFGEVYRATVGPEGLPGREVAVKVLRLERREQREAVGRLKDEAKMLAVLDHPAILRFEEFTRVEGCIALVTEYVEGVDLDRFVDAEHRMPPKVALEVIAQVASALQSALSTTSPETGNPLGLIHRDIKPHNIRISTRGEVKLLDFGIARTTELARDVKTWAGDVLCTAGYAGPEVLCGETPGPCGDIYSLGVTLFHVLCDEPFHTDLQISQQRRAVMLTSRYRAFLDERMGKLPELPEALVVLLRAMLGHTPEDRPDAAAVETQLRAIAATIEGPDLATWTMDLKPLPPEAKTGEFDHRTALEEVMSAEPTVVPVGATLRPPMDLPRLASNPPVKRQSDAEIQMKAILLTSIIAVLALVAWVAST